MTEVLNSGNFRTYRLVVGDRGEGKEPETKKLNDELTLRVIALLNSNRDRVEGPDGEQLDIPGINESTTIEGARKRVENIMKRDGGRLAIYLTYETGQVEDSATEKPVMAVVIGEETSADRYPSIKNNVLRGLLYLSSARSRAPELRIFGFGSEIADEKTEQKLFEQIIDDHVDIAEGRNEYPQRITMVEADGDRKPDSTKPRSRRMSSRLSNMGRFTDTFLEGYGKHQSGTE